MKKISKTIVFFGSGPVAAASLAQIAQDFPIEAVITKTTPAHHHATVPVAETAKKLDLPIEYVQNTTELSELIRRKHYQSKIGVIVDFAIIISKTIIDTFPLGIVNSHFSLLPLWRGADPITFAVLSGNTDTGVSLMLIAERLDEGQLIAQEKIAIPPDITTPELTKALVAKSNTMLKHYLPLYIAGILKPFPQDSHIEPTFSRKLTKEDGIVDWHRTAIQIGREVRAFAGWPKSRAKIGQIEVILNKVRVLDTSGEPGKATTIEKSLVVYCGQQALVIDQIQPIGKKQMSGQAFLAGYGQRLGL